MSFMLSPHLLLNRNTSWYHGPGAEHFPIGLEDALCENECERSHDDHDDDTGFTDPKRAL